LDWGVVEILKTSIQGAAYKSENIEQVAFEIGEWGRGKEVETRREGGIVARRWLLELPREAGKVGGGDNRGGEDKKKAGGQGPLCNWGDEEITFLKKG